MKTCISPENPNEADLRRGRAELFLTPEVEAVRRRWRLTRKQALAWKGVVPRKYQGTPGRQAVFILGQELGPLLRRRRVRQDWLAGQLGVSRVTISNWATGKTTPHPGQYAALRLVLSPLVSAEKEEERTRRAEKAARAIVKQLATRARTRRRVRAYRHRQAA